MTGGYTPEFCKVHPDLWVPCPECPPTRDTPEAALIAVFDREIARWQRAEAGTQQVTLAQYLAAILADLPDWTLVPSDEMTGTRALAAALEGKRDEIEKLRAALELVVAEAWWCNWGNGNRALDAARAAAAPAPSEP